MPGTNYSPEVLRRNLFFNSIHEFSWGLGMAFHTTYAIIPLFLKQLGAPDSIIISVAGLFSILMALPQLISATLLRNTSNIKKTAIITQIFAMPPVFLAGIIFVIFSPTGPYAWVLYYMCFIVYGLVIGFFIPVWTEFLAHLFPKKTRGHYLGISFAFTSVGGIIGGVLVKILFNSSLQFPRNFGWGFIFLSLAIILGTVVYTGMKVKINNDGVVHKTFLQFRAETKSIIFTDNNFRRYLISRAFIAAHFPAMSLYAVYTQRLFGFEISEAGIFTILQVITFGLASIAAGNIGDRWGHKTAIALSFGGYLMAIICTVYATSMVFVYAIFLFLGLGQGGFMPSAMNLVYEFADSRDTKTYMALVDTFLAPFIVIMIFLSSALEPVIGMRNLFIILGVLVSIGLVLIIFMVKEPRHHTRNVLVPPQTS